ncbi:MAG: hypothetical protein QXP36_09445 [Conexivisphaerales archaeon]
MEISSRHKGSPRDFVRLCNAEILQIQHRERGKGILLSKLCDFTKDYYDTNLLLDGIKGELADLNIQFKNTHLRELPETRDL